MSACIVPGCLSNLAKDSTLDFFLFPKNLELCQLWVQACNLVDTELNLDDDVLCSLHFDEDAFNLQSQMEDGVIYFEKKLKTDAVPTQNMPDINEVVESKTNITHLEIKNSRSSTAEDIASSSTQKCSDSTDFRKSNTYNAIKTKTQFTNLKDANQKLQKMVAEVEADVALQANIYKENLKRNTEVRNELKKYAKHVFSKQRTKAILSKVFSQTQIEVLLGKKKTFWSDHDMAVAYTIRHLSNISCYNYLMKNMNIPLPGLSSIKRWINVKNLGKKRTRKTKAKTDDEKMTIDGNTETKQEGEAMEEDNVTYLEEIEEIGDETD